MSKGSWEVYETPEGRARPEDRAAAGDLLPSAIQEVGPRPIRIRRRTLVVLGVVLAAVVAAPVALLATRSSQSSRAEPAIAFAPTLDPARFDTFVTALRKRTGTTTVASFAAYDGDYQVVIPPARKGDRAQSYSFYGDTGLRSEGDASSYPLGKTFDLSTLDVAALERLYERAWHDAGGKVTNTSLTVEPPAESDQHWVRIYIDHPGDSFYAVDGNRDGGYVSGRQID